METSPLPGLDWKFASLVYHMFACGFTFWSFSKTFAIPPSVWSVSAPSKWTWAAMSSM